MRLAHAVFYGDAGDKTAAQLEQDSNRLGVLPDDAGQAGAGSFEPTVWLSAWMKKELGAKPTEFTLLVCSTLEFESPSGPTTRTDKVLRHFRNLTLTNRTDGTTGGGNNSTTSTVTATGCFFSTQHVALYDTTIGYAPPPSGFHVTSITVSTGYDELSATTLTVLRNPNPANSPVKLKLRGPWDGLSNTWHMYVDVVYAPDSGSGTYGPEHHDVTFTGMLFNVGTIVVGEE